MYADKITKSMQRTIDETNRRRKIQIQYNKENGLTPTPLVKSKKMIIEATKVADGDYKSEDKKKTIPEQKTPTFKNTHEAEKKNKRIRKENAKTCKRIGFYGSGKNKRPYK